jgi:iron complex transport system substrate-binding protein
MTSPSPNRRTLALLAATAVALAALVGCSGSEEPPGSGKADGGGSESQVTAPSGEWTFTDDRGETVTLDEAPTTIAADAATAGGLWEYGVAVDGGVFGDIVLPDGTPSPGIGLADPDDFESVGDANQINLEQLAAHRPQVIIGAMWDDKQFYGIDPDQLDEVEAIAPLIGVRVDDRLVTEPLARVAEFAESLGADPDGKIAAAKATFDTASEAFSAANEAQPDLLVAAVSGSASEMYVAYPPKWPDLSYYQELGMNLVEPEDHPTAGGFWETLSWEEAGKYPVDLVMADGRGGSLESIKKQIPAVALSMPALDADQIVIWPAVHAYGYGYFATILDDLATAVADADPAVAGS